MCACTRNTCVCVYILPFKNDILRCLQALCLHSAFFQPLLFKNQSPANDRPQETVSRITHPHLSFFLSLTHFLSLSLSLSLSARKVSLFAQAPPPHSTYPPQLLHPWLERVASECQMYYRVSHSNVNTQPCHESRVVWPPSPPFPSIPSLPFPLLPPSQQRLPEGWRKHKTAEEE